MKPALTFDDMHMYLAHHFDEMARSASHGSGKKVRMVGILLARPDIPFARESIVPHLDNFHYRSGNYIDFYCVGYDGYTGRGADEGFKKVNADLQLRWSFSEKMFVTFVEEIEKRTNQKWRYSGEPELILANAHYDAGTKQVHLDLAHRVRCRLQQMQDSGAIRSVPGFFEDIFAYAHKADGEDPTWGFSDAQGVKLAGSALKRLVLSLLPKTLREEAARAAHLAVIDD